MAPSNATRCACYENLHGSNAYFLGVIAGHQEAMQERKGGESESYNSQLKMPRNIRIATAARGWPVTAMANEKRCETCTEECAKSQMAHEAAVGRMYATKLFVALQRRLKAASLSRWCAAKTANTATTK